MNEGIYEQLINQELYNTIKTLEAKNYLAQTEPLEVEEAHLVLSKYIEEVVRKALVIIRENSSIKKDENLFYQIELCNHIVRLLSEQLKTEDFENLQINEKSEMLLSIYTKLNSIHAIDKKVKPVRPVTSLSRSSLFTGSTKEPDLVSELRREIQSSDRIDMLISFIKWSGLRLIYDELKAFVGKPGHKVRIITTCYKEPGLPGSWCLSPVHKVNVIQ